MSFFSNFILALRFAKELMFNFKEATKEEAGVKESLYYLFLISLLPSFVVSFVIHLGSTVSPYVGSQFRFLTPLLNELSTGLIPDPAIILALFGFLLGATILGALIGSAVTHFFGRLFKWLKKDFSHTLAAVVFGSTPAIIFSWLPYLFQVFFSTTDIVTLIILLVPQFVIGIWSFIVQIYGFSNQHGIRKRDAIGVIIAPMLIVGVIVSVLASFILSAWLFSFTPTQTNLLSGGTQSVSQTPQEGFVDLTSKQFEILDAVCFPNSKYTVVLRNIDSINSIGLKDFSTNVDDLIAVSQSWSGPIPPGGTATLTIDNPPGGEPGSIHRIKIVGFNGFVQQVPVSC